MKNRVSRHQTIKAKAHCENGPATPSTRLSDRTTKSSALQFSTGAVIFDPGPATPSTRLSDRTTKSSALQFSTGAVIFDPGPATPSTRLSDRTTKSSALQFSTGAVIFDPVVKPIHAALLRQRSKRPCESVPGNVSALSEARFHE